MTTLALNNVRPYGEDVKHVLIDVAAGRISVIGDTPFQDWLLYTSPSPRDRG